MARASSRSRRLVRGCVSFLLLGPLIATVPASAQGEPTPGPELYDGTDVSEIPVAGNPVQAAPITDAERVPVGVPVDTNALVDPAFTELHPGTGDTLDELIGDKILVPTEGGPDFDAYSPEEGVGSHFLVVYPQVVNERNAQGEWVDLPDEFVPTADGWAIAGESLSIAFPTSLSPSSPIVSSTGEATLSIVPVDALPVPGVSAAGTTLTYPGALPATNLVYTALPGGYKEAVVLLGPLASGTVSWDVTATGYTLAPTADGRIEVLGLDGAVAFQMPAPSVSDASGATSALAYVLDDLGAGSYRITLAVDPGFLAEATFPVTIDPGTTQPAFLYDTYAKSSAAGTPHDSANPLITGPWTGSGTRYRTFFRFGTAWQSPSRVIYSAKLHIKNTSEPSASTPLEIDRATWDWSNFLTWNSMMAQPDEGVSPNPWVPDAGGPTNGWWAVELGRLYQPIIENVYPDYGFRLVSSDNKKFSSAEATGTANDPYLFVSLNTIPNQLRIVAGPCRKGR